MPNNLKDSRARIQDLETLVDVDPLTDTLNRRGFERELRRSLAYVKRYGTGCGVDLRRSRRLQAGQRSPWPQRRRRGAQSGRGFAHSRVRASDVVGRYGGDEFVVLLWNVRDSEAEAKARALETAVYGTPVQWGSSSLVVGASAGVALLGALDTPDEVLARADVAMYARKRERKGLAAPAEKSAAHAIMSGVSSSSMNVMRSRN